MDYNETVDYIKNIPGYHTIPGMGFNGKFTGAGEDPDEVIEINDAVTLYEKLKDIKRNKPNQKTLVILKKKIDARDYKVEVPSNTTIIGLNGTYFKGGFVVNDVHNLVFFNIKFEDSFNKSKTEDYIGVRRSTHILVLHCEFKRCYDEFIGFKENSSYLTVAYCKLNKDQKKGSLLNGENDTSTEKHGSLRCTWHHNKFRCIRRNPKLRNGLGHFYNNHFKKTKGYALCSTIGALAISEKNVFEKIERPLILKAPSSPEDEPGKIISYYDKMKKCPKNYVDESEKITEKYMEIPYKYTLDDASDVKEIVDDDAGILELNKEYFFNDTDSDSDSDTDEPFGFANEDGDDEKGPCIGGGDTDNVRVFKKGQEKQLENFLEASGERIAVLEGELDFSGDMLKVRGDITIEGKNCKVKNGGFTIINKMNIIIRNIEFKKYDGGDDQLDHINIEGSKYIWIDNCTFGGTKDGCVDIKKRSRYITVSNCTFSSGAKKCMLIGGTDDLSDTENAGGFDDSDIKVTIYKCKFYGDTRNPRCRFGVVHILNCEFEENDDGGPRSYMDARLFVEGCKFKDIHHRVMQSSTGGRIFVRENEFDDADLNEKYVEEWDNEIFKKLVPY